MSRLLVTGASGFIGSRVVHAAIARGHEVVAAVRTRARAARLGAVSRRVRIVEGDLADRGAIRRMGAAVAPERALHLAWSIPPDYRDSPDNDDCLHGSIALLRGLLDARCPRIVFVGTHHERVLRDADRVAECAAASRYACCKGTLLQLAKIFVKDWPTAFAWARLFTVYGPGQPDWALVPHIITHLLAGRRCVVRDGGQALAFIHVDDAARALLDLTESSLEGIVDIASPAILTVREIALRIGAHLGRADLLSFDEPAAAGPLAPMPSERLVAELGFEPRVDLDQGLAETIAWWRMQRAAVGAS